MAAAPANSDTDSIEAAQAKAEAYIGSLISLITKYQIRYEGFLFHLDAQACTISLRNGLLILLLLLPPLLILLLLLLIVSIDYYCVC